MTSQIHLKGVTLGLHNLFEPSSVVDGMPETYRAQLILDPLNEKQAAMLTQIGKASDAAMKAAFSEGEHEIDNGCIRNGDNIRSKSGRNIKHLEGRVVIQAEHVIQPRLFNRDKSSITEGDGLLYGGATVYAIITMSAKEVDGAKGVKRYLNAHIDGVMFLEHGTPHQSPGRVTADDFDMEGV